MPFYETILWLLWSDFMISINPDTAKIMSDMSKNMLTEYHSVMIFCIYVYWFSGSINLLETSVEWVSFGQDILY